MTTVIYRQNSNHQFFHSAPTPGKRHLCAEMTNPSFLVYQSNLFAGLECVFTVQQTLHLKVFVWNSFGVSHPNHSARQLWSQPHNAIVIYSNITTQLFYNNILYKSQYNWQVSQKNATGVDLHQTKQLKIIHLIY